jgi:IS30 family transposase
MNHFTAEQRYKLEVLLQKKTSKEQISVELKKYISSIYRDIKRNSDERNFVHKGNLAIRKFSKTHVASLKINVLNLILRPM